LNVQLAAADGCVDMIIADEPLTFIQGLHCANAGRLHYICSQRHVSILGHHLQVQMGLCKSTDLILWKKSRRLPIVSYARISYVAGKFSVGSLTDLADSLEHEIPSYISSVEILRRN
jgi:hypothetical protein